MSRRAAPPAPGQPQDADIHLSLASHEVGAPDAIEDDLAAEHQPLSAARLTALTRWAQCIRQHGVADFPDPDSQGNFPTQHDPTMEAGWAAAYQACKSLQPQGKS